MSVRALVFALGLVGIGADGAAFAQSDYPNRTVTVVSPFVAGGMSSLLARAVAQRLEQRLGRAFIIENRPGGGSITGAVSVAHAQPDGYTLLIAPSTTIATNVSLYKSLPYDPVADFIPLALVARVPEVLVVNSALPVRTLDDLVKLAKATPGRLTFGSSGVGTAQHLNGEVLKNRLGIDMTHIPYRGIAPALNDAAGGHISLMFTDIPISMPLMDAGKLRPIGVTTAERVAALPNVPALAEIGLAGFDEASWFMMLAPARTPRDIAEKLAAEIGLAVHDAAIRQEFIRLGLLPVDSPGIAALQALIQTEIQHSGDVVRRIGLAGVEQAKE
jgi:tripartite-type tricarboxylate transporter receptor subunit TctC